MPTIEEIQENLSNYSDADLQNLKQDERTGVQELAQREIDSRAEGEHTLPLDEYDPRKDPGPERYEDRVAVEDETPLSSPKVDPEESRRDETTVLAGDVFDLEGNRKE